MHIGACWGWGRALDAALRCSFKGDGQIRQCFQWMQMWRCSGRDIKFRKMQKDEKHTWSSWVASVMLGSKSCWQQRRAEPSFLPPVRDVLDVLLATQVSQHRGGSEPWVLLPMPIGPLRSSNLPSQSGGSNLSWGMLQIGPEMAPKAAGFHFIPSGVCPGKPQNRW